MSWEKKVTNRVSFLFTRKNLINEKNVVIFEYGFRMLLNSLSGVVICVLVGLFHGIPLLGFLYSILCSILRPQAGGFHFSSTTACFWCSLILDVIMITVIKLTSETLIIEPFYILLLLGSLIIITVLAPVDTPNKQLDTVERKVYRKRSIVLALIYSILALIAKSIGLASIYITFLFVMLMIAFLLCIGYLNNITGKTKH